MVEKDSKRREVLKMAKWDYNAILDAVKENLMRMIARSNKAKEIAKYHASGELIIEEGYPWALLSEHQKSENLRRLAVRENSHPTRHVSHMSGMR